MRKELVIRLIVYGVGAIGGAIAAAVQNAGYCVVGIARGAQLVALQSSGLRLRTPKQDFTVKFECVSQPQDLRFADDDVILLTMKSQDTLPALHALRDAGVRDQAIFCFQNGVANERCALRYFANVHGVTVMMPAQFLQPGEVSIAVAPKFGMFDVGRAPNGIDRDDEKLIQVLEQSNFAAYPSADVMQSKYGKLRMNLGNIVQAALGKGVAAPDILDAMRQEFDRVAAASRLRWIDVDDDARRMAHIQPTNVPGVDRIGGSSAQSLLRGAKTLETDYLNGEVALLGRLHGIATPVNARAGPLTHWLIRNQATPGAISAQALSTYFLDGASLPNSISP